MHIYFKLLIILYWKSTLFSLSFVVLWYVIHITTWCGQPVGRFYWTVLHCCHSYSIVIISATYKGYPSQLRAGFTTKTTVVMYPNPNPIVVRSPYLIMSGQLCTSIDLMICLKYQTEAQIFLVTYDILNMRNGLTLLINNKKLFCI